MAHRILDRQFKAELQRKEEILRQIRPVSARLSSPIPVRELFERCMDCIDKCASWRAEGGPGRSATEWIEAWFPGSDVSRIGRGNMIEWLAWSLRTKQLSELTHEEHEELVGFLDRLEARFHWNLRDGYNKDVQSFRSNFNSIVLVDKGLNHYASMRTLSATAYRTLRALGFKHYDNENGLSYFHVKSLRRAFARNFQPCKISPQQPPVVFIHGLGVGLFPYISFLRRLAGERECFVIELPEVSQVGCDRVLPPSIMAKATASMLEAHGHSRACFIGHSYGTAVLSWVARWQPDILARAVFLDPICFLLVQPDVANFLYREPANIVDTALAYLVRWELYTANVLFRNFYWYQNTLWPDEIPDNTLVFLSGKDHIIDPELVRHYLEYYSRKNTVSDLEIIFEDSFTHGQLLASKEAREELICMI